MNNKKSIFVSYCWNDSKIVDEIESSLEVFQYNLIRDIHELKYKDSISNFMEKIRTCDFSILIISPSYLRSKNCMKEVLHVIKEIDFKKRVLPIIIGDVDIYSSEGRINISRYWLEKKSELEALIKTLPPTNIINEIQELKFLEEINSNINNFLGYLSDSNNITYENLKKENYKTLFESLGMRDLTHLFELLKISLLDNTETQEIKLDDWAQRYTPTTDFYSLKAKVASESNKFSNAETYYNRSLKLDKKNFVALNNYGFMLYRTKTQPDKAKDLFEKAIKYYPQHTIARLNLGCLLSRDFNDLAGAKEQYEKIISYNPTESRAYANLANYYKAQKNTKETQNIIIELYNQALKFNNDYIEAHLALGSYLSEFLGKHDEAIQHYDEILRIDPRSIDLVNTLKERVEKIRYRGLIICS